MNLPARRKPPKSGIPRGGPLRSPRHLKFIRGFVCAVCGSDKEIEAAHIRIGTDGSLSEKPSDAWALPVCATDHARQHDIGEPTFWREAKINPHALARTLAMKSPDEAVRAFAGTMTPRKEIRP